MNTEKRNTILITGGTSGLGRSLVRLFLERGWNVATLGRRSSLLEKLSEEFPGDNLLAIQCDINVASQLTGFFTEVKGAFGAIDATILNAGTLGPSKLPEISELSLIELRMTFETNLFANFNIIRESLALREGRQILVHVTSDAVKGLYPGWGAYGASKAAMDFIIGTLQKESCTNEVVAVSFDPGDMDTEMHRKALPDDKDLKDPGVSTVELFNLVTKLGVRAQ